MHSTVNQAFSWRDRLTVASALLLLAFGVITIVGWLLHVPTWHRVFHGVAATVPGGLCFALAGGSLLAWRHGSLHSIRTAQALGLLLMLIGMGMLAEYTLDLDLGIDLRALHAWLHDGNPWPGRISPTLAFAMLLSGLALTLPAEEMGHRLRRTFAAAVLVHAIVNLVAFMITPDPSSAPTVFQTAVMPSWYRLPLSHPFISSLVILVAMNMLWLDDLRQPATLETTGSYRKSDIFFGVALSLLITVATISYGSVKDMQARISSADESYRIRIAFEELIINYDRAQAIWGRTIGGAQPQPYDLKAFEAAAEDTERQITELLDFLPDDSGHVEQLIESRRLLRGDFEFMRGTLQRKLQGEIADDASILETFREPHLHIEQVLEQIVRARDAETELLQRRREVSLTSVRAAITVIVIGNVAGFAVLMIAFWTLLMAQKQRARLEAGLRSVNEELESRVAERTEAVLSANRELEAINTTLEQRVEERTAALEERTADLEDFSYSVSHDLRAPLRAIDGYALMLSEDHTAQLDDDGKLLLTKMRSYVKRMGDLVDDLLRLSRFGRQALVRSQVDMSMTVSEVWQEALHDLEGKPPTPALELQLLPDATGDVNLLRQVWINLIGNAIKYSSRVAEPLIVVSATQTESENIYAIRDNGAGFDMAYADKLFGVFQRLHDQHTFSGTGVGLAIVHKIIRRHGGRVWAESALNAGATFYFTLPRKPPQSTDTWQ